VSGPSVPFSRTEFFPLPTVRCTLSVSSSAHTTWRVRRVGIGAHNTHSAALYAQGRARHANPIHPADEATGQVDATDPPQREAMEGAIAGHERIQWYM
jgi:hypothetical protein